MEVSALYLESLTGNTLMAIMHHPPQRMYRGVEVTWKDRAPFHKVARLIYKGFRAFYVSTIFYYVPYSVIFWQWITLIKGEEDFTV